MDPKLRQIVGEEMAALGLKPGVAISAFARKNLEKRVRTRAAMEGLNDPSPDAISEAIQSPIRPAGARAQASSTTATDAPSGLKARFKGDRGRGADVPLEHAAPAPSFMPGPPPTMPGEVEAPKHRDEKMKRFRKDIQDVKPKGTLTVEGKDLSPRIEDAMDPRNRALASNRDPNYSTYGRDGKGRRLPATDEPHDMEARERPGSDVLASVLSPDQVGKIRELLKDHHDNYSQTELPSAEERQFQKDVKASFWYQDFTRTFGAPPDLDDPTYDYRGAWKAGQMPESRPGAHWPDRSKDGKWLKSPEHQSAWMEYYQATTGRDPEADGITPDQFWSEIGDPLSLVANPALVQGAIASGEVGRPDPDADEGTQPGAPQASRTGPGGRKLIPLTDLIRRDMGALRGLDQRMRQMGTPVPRGGGLFDNAPTGSLGLFDRALQEESYPVGVPGAPAGGPGGPLMGP